MVIVSELAAWASAAGLDEASIVLESIDGALPAVNARLDAGRLLYPASMIKTPLAAATYVLADRGEIDLGAPVVVDERNMTVNDLASPLVPGFEARIDELIDLMITQSDNVATNVLIDVVGRARASALLHERGLIETTIHRKLSGSDPLIEDPEATGRNAHPAGDAARLFAELASDQWPQAGLLRGALARQRWNTKLTPGLDSADRFAHKTGDTSQVSHDGGLLTTSNGRTYVLVVYTALPSSDETDARFATFMRSLRPHL